MSLIPYLIRKKGTFHGNFYTRQYLFVDFLDIQ